MKRSTRWFLVLMSLAALLTAAFIGVAMLTSGRPTVHGNSVLAIDLSGDLPEQDPHASLNSLLGVHGVTLQDLVAAIDAAATDPRIAAIRLRIGRLDVGWAKAREVRDALLRFRKSGKPLHAYLEDGDDGTYYVASAADEVRMPETETLWLDGISAEVTFYGGTLEKVGVTADLEQIGEYKNAADVMMRKTMSPAHREAVNSLVESLYDELVAQLAESLGKTDDEVRKIISAGPYTAQQALAAGLVHAVAFEDEDDASLDAALGEHEAPRIPLEKYLATRRAPHGPQTVAVVNCIGTIVPGESSQGLLGGATMGSDTIVKAIHEAADEDGAVALVLRVDSPGGSPGASDAIWRAAHRAQAKGVPVVVSMSDVAASGGYWISMGADKVVAEPSTITGSIGIFGGKYVVAELDKLIGMNAEAVDRGENASFNSTLRPFTPEQRDWLRNQLRTVYQTFLEKTAAGRGFASADQVDRYGRGRVWTGRQAKDIGLVDELGGLREAVATARRLAHVPDGLPVTIRSYPRTPGLFESLMGNGYRASLAEAVHARVAAEIRSQLPESMVEAVAVRQLLAQLQREGVLAYMPYRVLAR